jgi:hypothetical protein
MFNQLIAGVVGPVLVVVAGHHHHDDDDDGGDTKDTVCQAFNQGMTPDQIAGGLQRNDGRINEWQAWRDTAGPIVSGDCDD